jgi:hypothetical protein
LEARYEVFRAGDLDSFEMQRRKSYRLCPNEVSKEIIMSKEQEHKAIVGRWFADFWGPTCNLGIVDQLAAPDMLLQYSLHEPRRGHVDIKAFMAGFREAFPDLKFGGAADLIAEGYLDNHPSGARARLKLSGNAKSGSCSSGPIDSNSANEPLQHTAMLH